MNQKRALIGIGVGVVLYYLVKGVQFVQGVFFGIPKNIRLTGTGISLSLPIINTSDVTVNIDKVDGQLLFKGQRLAFIDSTDAVQVTQRQTIDLPIFLASDNYSVLGALQSLFQGNNLGQLYFQGYIQMNGIPVPIRTRLI